MNKIGSVIIVVCLVIVCYLFMLIVIPGVVVPMVSTANTTIAATSNVSDYPGTTSFLLSIPWILWFVPACIGTVVIVVLLKQP